MYRLLILVSSILILGVACNNGAQADTDITQEAGESDISEESSAAGADAEAALGRFIEAMQNGDAATVMEFYPAEAVFQMEMQLEQMKNDTTGQVTVLFAQMGVEVTPAELQNWTVEDMLEAQITSPMTQGQFDGVTIIGSTVEGNTAIVEFEMTIAEQIIMILEDGQWKMSSGY